ncbi:hypothetical protein CNYM01_13697 [Colletotrichum nymphaeae SA-01]|uniref:Uncharacterized protein n=1 Tax=Colletotrichum nymphaeae SA-01 TaxID=1460502 RepID=A0A135UUL1_9PEZI|nr:hypothetical protein CNYM01_13697 [Colletotrichum nymphaeae SA-01]
MFRPIKAILFYIITDSSNILASLNPLHNLTPTSPQNNISERLTSIFFHTLHSTQSPPTPIQYKMPQSSSSTRPKMNITINTDVKVTDSKNNDPPSPNTDPPTPPASPPR